MKDIGLENWMIIGMFRTPLNTMIASGEDELGQKVFNEPF